MSWIKNIFTKKDRPKSKATIEELGQELLPHWRQAISQGQDAGQTDAAMASYLKIIQKCPTALSAHDNLAGLYMRQKKNEQALAELEKAVHPLYPNAYVTLGALYYSMGSLDKAIAEFEKAGKEKSAFTNLCSAYFFQGNYDAAINAGEKAIEQDPKDLNAYGNLARAYLKVGKEDKFNTLVANASEFIDVNLIKPGVVKNWFIHLVIYDPETQSILMIDPRSNEKLYIKTPFPLGERGV